MSKSIYTIERQFLDHIQNLFLPQFENTDHVLISCIFQSSQIEPQQFIEDFFSHTDATEIAKHLNINIDDISTASSTQIKTIAKEIAHYLVDKVDILYELNVFSNLEDYPI